MNTVLSTIIDFLFPKRKQEKNVADIDINTIINLKKADFVDENINSLFSYKEKIVKDLIWELKYHRNREVLEKIGIIMSDVIKDDLSEKLIFDKNKKYILVPIPITNQRLFERGFCQTELLCEEIVKNIKQTEFENLIMYNPNALKKIMDTKKQSWSKNRDERLLNLKNCFSADKKIVEGKNIILIDDVVTTGATIEEARKTLLNSLAKEVIVYTIAH